MGVATLVTTTKKNAASSDCEKMPPPKASATSKLLASRVTANVKLPPFTADMAGVRFNQIEVYLTIKGIADRILWFLTRFIFCVAE